MEIQQAKDTLSIKYAEARQLASEDSNYADALENIAIGLHRDSKEKLVDYDIVIDTPKQPKPAPSMALTVILNDDTDGEGFVVFLQSPDPVADSYEWEKGSGADPSDLNTIPPMTHLRITSKTSFVDDDVAKGVRYFYRVRSINSRGEGPWSSPWSRVQ